MQILLELSADLGITATDAHADPSISEITEARSELVCLALWLMMERSKVYYWCKKKGLIRGSMV